MSNKPRGGTLVNLLGESHYTQDLGELRRWALTPRQLCDFELLANGGFSPLEGFMCSKDYEAVCVNMRLVSGEVWPIPIVLDIPKDFAKQIKIGEKIILEDNENVPLGTILVEDLYRPDREREAKLVYGTTDSSHPGVSYILEKTNEYYIGGRVEAYSLPHKYDFSELRLTPAETRESFKKLGWDKVVAFQTRNPMHKAHVELTRRACEDTGANLLIHPSVGVTKPGDVDHFTRVRVYKEIIKKYPPSTASLSLLPLAMRMAGPREALWHSIIRKNYGCTHFIVGRDHAGPGKDKNGKNFYGEYEAQELVKKYSKEIGIDIVPYKNMVYVENTDSYKPSDELAPGDEAKSISGTELRKMLDEDKALPEWFTYKEVETELKKSYKPLRKRGMVVFFTGLSGSGKSTLARGLEAKLHEEGGRTVTVLDGDVVRKHLSSELTFSREHRDLNIKRIGYVASEIAKHGGYAICAPIAPYDAAREQVRELVESTGSGFLMVYVDTPLAVCEKRDRKGLYKLARGGKIKHFTGIDDPYEKPKKADYIADTVSKSREELVQNIYLAIEKKGYI